MTMIRCVTQTVYTAALTQFRADRDVDFLFFMTTAIRPKRGKKFCFSCKNKSRKKPPHTNRQTSGLVQIQPDATELETSSGGLEPVFAKQHGIGQTGKTGSKDFGSSMSYRKPSHKARRIKVEWTNANKNKNPTKLSDIKLGDQTAEKQVQEQQMSMCEKWCCLPFLWPSGASC